MNDADEYLKAVEKKAFEKIGPLTNTQRNFAEWLLLPENDHWLMKIGNLEDVFDAIRSYRKKYPRNWKLNLTDVPLADFESVPDAYKDKKLLP